MNLLITGAWNEAKIYIEEIKDQGNQVVFLQFENEQLPCEYEWVEGVIGNGIFLSHPIEKFKNLKYIQLTSSGYDRVSMDYVKKNIITIYNARGVYSIPMAEYAIASVLNIYKCQNFFWDKQKQHRWEKRRDLKELGDQSVCILGCGSVGTECAKRFNAFGCTVWGIDKYVSENEYFESIYSLDSLRDVLSKSDIVIITLPLSDDTYHMFNDEMFLNMKVGALLINIARGAIVDTKALIVALKDKLGGAVLDVFEEEPLNDSLLWDLENVIITPHNSFVGTGNNGRLSAVIMSNLYKYGIMR